MAHPYLLFTQRCRLRPMQPDDAGMMYQLNLDPEVIRYTGDPPFEGEAAARQFLERYDQYEKYGVGRWMVERISDGEVIGWCGLKYHPDTDLYDLGFRFFQKVWGQGYATETGAACLQYGRDRLGLTEIYAHAMTENVASWRVLEKLGMVRLKKIIMEGEPAWLYRIQF